MVVARRKRRVTPTITDEEQSNISSSLHKNKIATMSPEGSFNDTDNLLICSYMNNSDNVNNSDLQQSRPPLSPSPTKTIIQTRKSTTTTTTNCEDNSSFNMSSSISVDNNDCGDSLNNSMSLTDLHTTSNTPANHSAHYNNTIGSNINSTSDLSSISPIKESISDNMNIVRKISSIDDSYNKSCGTEHQINVARNIAKDVINTNPTISKQQAVDKDVVSRLNKTIATHKPQSPNNNNNPLANPPNHFKCPISSTLLIDPVIDVEGNTYERTNILKWLVLTSSVDATGGAGVSPITGNSISIDELEDDVVVKSAIDRWKKECWVRFLMSSNAKDVDTEDIEETEYYEGFDKEEEEDGGGGGLSEVQQMLLASVENDKKLLGNGSSLKGGGGMMDVSERSGKSATSQKKGGVDTSERSGSVSSKKSTKSKSSSKGSKTKKKIYSIDGDKLGISLHDEESCDKIDMSDRSAKSERPRSSSGGGGLSSELDTFILKNKKKAGKNGGSVSHASHISGASQVSTGKDDVVLPYKSQVIKKKGSKSPYRKGGKTPPPPPPPNKHSPSNSSSSFGSKKLTPRPITLTLTKRPKDEQHRNKSISSSQTTAETSTTTPTRPRSTTSSTTPKDSMRAPPLTSFSVPTKQEDGSNIAELSSYSRSLTQESSVPVRDIVPQHNKGMSSASSFCSNLSGNFSDMMSLQNDDFTVFNQPTTRTRPQHNGWSVPLGVHRVTCAMPGLQVTTQVHRRSIPVKVNRTVMSNYGTCEVEKQNMIVSPGSYVEVVETQVHGDRVRGRICWEEEEEDTDAQLNKKKKKTIKKRISRQIKRTTRRGRERGKSKEKVMKIVTYEGWISLQWAKDDDKNEDLEKLEESRIGMDTDEDVGPWTEPVPLGVYRINFSGGLPLRQSSERESDVIGKLERGRCVEVVQTEVKGDRVRARVIVPNLPQDDESTSGGQVKFTSGWVSLLNALTGSSGASLVPLGAYVVVAEPGCVITEGGRLDSKVKGKLIPGSCCEVVATRMEEGVVRGLLEEGGHVTLFAPPRGSVTVNTSNGARKQDTGRMFAMPVPLGTYQIIHNGLPVTADISVTSSTQTKLQQNTNVEVLETRVDEGRVRGRVCVVGNERQLATGSCAGSTSGSQAGMIHGWINLFEPNQRWAKIVSFKGGRPVKVDGGVPRRKNSHA